MPDSVFRRRHEKPEYMRKVREASRRPAPYDEPWSSRKVREAMGAAAAGPIVDLDTLGSHRLDDPHAAVEFVEDLDPVPALEAIGALREWLDEAEDGAVLRARIEGLSWARIGKLLRRSKQAVWEKHRDPHDRTDDLES